MTSDTPPPNSCRSRSPYLDRLNRLGQALALALEGDTASLPGVAGELARLGWGGKLDLLGKLTAAFARKDPSTTA